MIKGVPEELQAAYNLNPQQFDLLGVMADAADDNEEPEVAECLRWLWRWEITPEVLPNKGVTWGFTFSKTPVLGQCRLFLLSPTYEDGDTPVNAIERLLKGFPQWKRQHSKEYQRLSVPPSTLTLPTTPF